MSTRQVQLIQEMSCHFADNAIRFLVLRRDIRQCELLVKSSWSDKRERGPIHIGLHGLILNRITHLESPTVLTSKYPYVYISTRSTHGQNIELVRTDWTTPWTISLTCVENYLDYVSNLLGLQILRQHITWWTHLQWNIAGAESTPLH